MNNDNAITNPFKHKNQTLTYLQDFENKLRKTAELEILRTQTQEEQDLYRTNYRAWRKEYSPVINDYIHWHSEIVAPIMANKIGNALLYYDEVQYAISKKHKEIKNVDSLLKKRTSFYKKYGIGLFDSFTGKNNLSLPDYFVEAKPTYVSHHTTPYGVMQTGAEIHEALKNIKDKDRAVFFDLETLGGKNAQGQTVLEQITEFTFKTFDSTGKDINTSFSSIIGSTYEQNLRYSETIDRIAKGQGNLSDEDKVIFDRLKRMGASTVDWDNAKDGIVHYKTFSGEVSGMNIELARKGLKQLRDIGIYQEKAPLVEYNGQQMRAWEKSLFQALDLVQNNDYTLAGYNIKRFDIPMINRFLSSNLQSAGAINYAKQKYFGGIKPKYIMDAMVAERLYAPHMAISDKQRDIAKEYNLTAHTQEALVRNYFPDFYDKAGAQAHTSEIDVQAGAKLLFESGRYTPGHENSIIPDKEPTKDIILSGGNKQLLYAPKSLQPNSYGLFGFSSETTDSYHTADSFIISKDNQEKVIFGQIGLKRGASYSIDSITEIEITDQLKKDFKELYPSLDSNKLFSITFRPETDRGLLNLQSKSTYTYIGTEDNIKHLVNNMYVVANKGTSGKWTSAGISDETFEDLSHITVQDGKIIRTPASKDPNTYLKATTEILLNEPAARKTREVDLRKDGQLIKWINTMDEYAKREAGENATEQQLDEKRKEFRKLELEKAETIERRKLAGETISSDEYGHIHKIFGWQPKGAPGQYNIFRNTIDLSLAREVYGRRNKAVIESSIKFAQEHESTDIAIQDRYYKYAMEALQEKAIFNNGNKAVGKKIIPYHAYEYKNVFEVDLNGYKNQRIPEPDIFRVNLNSPYALVDSLLKHQDKNIDLSKVSDATKLTELKRFQDFLYDNRIFRSKGVPQEGSQLIDVNKDTVDTASRKILYRLNQTREINPNAGILKDTLHHDVINIDVDNFGLSELEINKTLAEANLSVPNYSKIAKKVKLGDGNISTEQFAKNFVNDVVFQKLGNTKEEEITNIVQQTGYSKKDAETLYNMRQIRRRDAQNFFGKIFGYVTEAGGDIAYTDNSLFIINKDGSVHEINDVMHDVMSGGIMHTEIGRTKTANAVGYYRLGYQDKTYLSFGSRIAKAANEVNWAKKAIVDRGTETGDIAGEFQSVIKQFNQVLRQAASTDKGDAQDMKTMSNFETIGIRESLADMVNDGIFDDVKPAYIKGTNTIDTNTPSTILYNFLSEYKQGGKSFGKDIDVEHLPYNVITALNLILPQKIQKGEINNYIRAQNTYGHIVYAAPKDMIENVSAEYKKAHEGTYTILDNDDYGDRQGGRQRHEADAMARSFRFNVNEVQQAVDSKQVQDISIGSSIQTAQRSYQDTANETNRIVRARNLSITTDDLRELFANDKELDDKARDFLETLDTHENSQAISAQLADAVFTNRSSTQKQNILKLSEVDGEVLTRLNERRRVTPTLSIQDGKITFNYSNGLFVQEGENLTYIKGYKEAQEEVVSKYNGFLRYGIYDATNNLVSDEQLQNLLNKQGFMTQDEFSTLSDLLTKSKNVSRGHVNLFQAQAWAYFNNILSKNGLSSYLYVDSLEMQSNIKLGQNSAEKGMSRVIAPLIGSIDTRLRKTFTDLIGEADVELGSSGKERDKVIKRFGVNEFLDTIPKKFVLDSMLDEDIANSYFGLAINGFRKNKALTSEQMVKTIQDNGFNTVEDFYKAILDERYFISNQAQEAFKRAGLIQDNEFINVISNPLEGEVKHKTVGVVPRRVASALLDKGLSAQEVANELSGVVSDIHVDENGNLIGTDEQTNFSKLQEVIKKHNLDIGSVRTVYTGKLGNFSQEEYDALTEQEKAGLRKTTSFVSMDEFQQMQNYDMERVHSAYDAFGKEAKFTHRNLEIMQNMKYDGNILNEIQERYISTYGQDIGLQKYSQRFENVEDNASYFGQVIDSIKQKKYMVSGEDLIQRFDTEGNPVDFQSVPDEATDIQISNAATLNKHYQEKANQAINRLKSDGIEDNYINAIIKQAQKEGAKGVTESYIRNQYTLTRFAQAKKFNDKNNTVDLDWITKRNFKAISIEDIVTDTDIYDAVDNSIYGKNLLLDLHMDSLGDRQLYTDESNRYIALPYLSKQYMSNDDIVKSEYQKQVASLYRTVQDFQQQNTAGEISDNDLDAYRSNVAQKVSDIQNTISTEFTKKKRILAKASEIRLGDSIMATTNGLDFTGRETNRSFTQMNFQGKNLVEMAAQLSESQGKKGFDLSFVIGSQRAMHRLYNEKYIQDIAGSIGMDVSATKQFREGLYEQLRTGGTLSLNSRDPQGYISSTNLNALYFNDTVHGDTLLVSAALQEAMRNDNDSDKISVALLKGDADITFTDSNGNKRTVTQAIDYATYQALANMDNVDVLLHNDTQKMFQDATRSMIADAATVNNRYNRYSHLKEGESPVHTLSETDNPFRTDHVAELTIDGTTEGNMAKTSGKKYSLQEAQRLSQQYYDIENKFLATLDDEGIKSYVDSSAAQQRTAIRDWGLNNNIDTQTLESSLEYRLNAMDKASQLVASDARKAGAGSMNFNAFRFLMRARQSNAFTGTELRDIMQVHTALNEAFLSPKNEKGVGNLEYINQVQDAMADIYDASRSGNGNKITSAKQNMINLLENTIGSRKELTRLNTIYETDNQGNILRDAEGNARVLDDVTRRQRAFETFASFAERVNIRQLNELSERAGTSQKGLASGSPLMYTQDSDNLIQENIRSADEIDKALYNDGGVATPIKGAVPSKTSVLDMQTPPLDKSILNDIEIPQSAKTNIEESVTDNVINKISRKGGIGSLVAGIGAGILLSGYGSSPATPPETQAAGASEEYADNYPQNIPQLADPNLLMSNNGTPSYMINISGSSSQGQDYAMNVINNAISSQVPLSASINLQMNTSFADKISQLQIDKMVANSMAF